MLMLLFFEASPLSVDVTTLVVFIVALLMAALLNTLLFKPTLSVLDERERRTTGTLAEATALMTECDRKLAGYEQTLRDARAETYRMLESQRKEALDEQAQIMARAKQEALDLINRAREEIAAEAERAKQGLEQEGRLMGGTIAASILRRPIEETASRP